MALWSSVTVLVAHPESRSQPAIASKNNFFIARNIDPSTTIAPGKEHWNQELPSLAGSNLFRPATVGCYLFLILEAIVWQSS